MKSHEGSSKNSRQEIKQKEKSGSVGWKLAVIGMAVGFLMLVIAVWNPFSVKSGIQILLVILGGLGLGLAITGSWLMYRTSKHREDLNKKKSYRQESDRERNQMETRQKRLTEIENYVNRLCGREETLLQQIEEKSTMIQNLRENRTELAERPQEIRKCEIEIQSLDLAQETLGKLSGGMRRRIGHRLQGRMEEILSEITEGKYGQISIDENMRISLYEWNRPVSLHQLSRGTVEQVYLALRMAVSEVLCEEQMPVLLDDVFAMYDEKRLAQTLRWLSKRGGQVLIFTCHRREMELLRQLGIRPNIIELENI